MQSLEVCDSVIQLSYSPLHVNIHPLVLVASFSLSIII